MTGAAGEAFPTIDRRRPVASQAYGLLRDQIINLRLAPGQALSEKELGDQLGISRTPVREALIKLADEGLVDVYPQVGTFVAPIRLPAFAEAQFVREALECAIVREAAARIDGPALATLRALVEEQRRAAEAGAFDAFYAADERMHQALSAAAGRPGVWRTVQNAKVHMDRVRRLTLPVPSRLSEVLAQHAGILDALDRRDGEAAAVAMREHLRDIFKTLDVLISAQPGYFETGAAARRAARPGASGQENRPA